MTTRGSMDGRPTLREEFKFKETVYLLVGTRFEGMSSAKVDVRTC